MIKNTRILICCSPALELHPCSSFHLSEWTKTRCTITKHNYRNSNFFFFCSPSFALWRPSLSVHWDTGSSLFSHALHQTRKIKQLLGPNYCPSLIFDLLPPFCCRWRRLSSRGSKLLWSRQGRTGLWLSSGESVLFAVTMTHDTYNKHNSYSTHIHCTYYIRQIIFDLYVCCSKHPKDKA